MIGHSLDIPVGERYPNMPYFIALAVAYFYHGGILLRYRELRQEGLQFESDSVGLLRRLGRVNVYRARI